MNLLLVEDDLSIGRLVSRGLRDRGHKVVWERRGKPAEALLRSGDFAAVILDLGLPDCDGLNLCRAARDAGAEIPILMLTARGELQDKLDGFEAGADDYLPKPFAFEELAARLGVLFKRHRQSASGGPRFGALVLDKEKRTASVSGAPVPLSRREYDLLDRLVAGGGAFVSRDDLIRAVWDDPKTPSNALDVYLRRLRHRLIAHAQAPQIITKRRIGCKLVAM